MICVLQYIGCTEGLRAKAAFCYTVLSSYSMVSRVPVYTLYVNSGTIHFTGQTTQPTVLYQCKTVVSQPDQGPIPLKMK